ncbi:MAG: DUF1499 domain-containing protein [Gammaproteobacteria bacterium]
MKKHTFFISFICMVYFLFMPESVKSETLEPCPDSPNCVSSLSQTDAHAIAPFSFSGNAEEAWQTLISLLQDQKRTAITEQSDQYLHAEVSSLIFRFVDDIEFLLLPDEHLIHLRSASRTGYSDFGVNRKRVEQLREAFVKASSGARNE